LPIDKPPREKFIIQHSGTYGKPVSRNWQARSALRKPATQTAGFNSGKGKSGAHIRWMDQILPSDLNAFEFEALRQIAAHPASHHVPSRVQSRLKDIGYVKEVLGGLVLTDDGSRRIAMEKLSGAGLNN
jgi:hypothetical protein